MHEDHPVIIPLLKARNNLLEAKERFERINLIVIPLEDGAELKNIELLNKRIANLDKIIARQRAHFAQEERQYE